MLRLTLILFLVVGCQELKKSYDFNSELYNNNIAIFKGTYISHNIDKLIIELSDSLIVDGKKSNIINVPRHSTEIEASKTEVICPLNEDKATYKTPINYIAYTDYSYSSSDGVKHIFPDTLTLVKGMEVPSTFYRNVGDIDIAEHKWTQSQNSTAKHDIWISNDSESNVKIKVKIQYFSKRGVKVFENYVTIEQLFNSKDTKKVSVNSKLKNSDIINSARITIDSIYYID